MVLMTFLPRYVPSNFSITYRGLRVKEVWMERGEWRGASSEDEICYQGIRLVTRPLHAERGSGD